MTVNLLRISGDATIPANAASKVSWIFGTGARLGNQTALMYQGMQLALLASTDLSTNTARLNAYGVPRFQDELLGYVVPTSPIPLITLDMNKMVSLYRQAGWDGTITIKLEWAGSSDLTLVTTSGGIICTGEIPIDSGTSGFEAAHSRVERCPICGTFLPVERMVEDGFRHGLRVCPSCYDPPDPLERNPYRSRERGERH